MTLLLRIFMFFCIGIQTVSLAFSDTLQDTCPVITSRRSCRSYDSTYAISLHELLYCFEAARWAPSSYNEQPWQFHYVCKDDASWEKSLSWIVESNKKWAQDASALIVVTSCPVYQRNNLYNEAHAFDTGAAVQNFCLQAHLQGLATCVIGGIHKDLIKNDLDLDDTRVVHAVVVVGKQALTRTVTSSDRKKLDDIVIKIK